MTQRSCCAHPNLDTKMEKLPHNSTRYCVTCLGGKFGQLLVLSNGPYVGHVGMSALRSKVESLKPVLLSLPEQCAQPCSFLTFPRISEEINGTLQIGNFHFGATKA